MLQDRTTLLGSIRSYRNFFSEISFGYVYDVFPYQQNIGISWCKWWTIVARSSANKTRKMLNCHTHADITAFKRDPVNLVTRNPTFSPLYAILMVIFKNDSTRFKKRVPLEKRKKRKEKPSRST